MAILEMGLKREEADKLAAIADEMFLLTTLSMSQLESRKDRNFQFKDEVADFFQSRKTIPQIIIDLELEKTLVEHINRTGNGNLSNKVGKLLSLLGDCY